MAKSSGWLNEWEEDREAAILAHAPVSPKCEHPDDQRKPYYGGGYPNRVLSHYRCHSCGENCDPPTPKPRAHVFESRPGRMRPTDTCEACGCGRVSLVATFACSGVNTLGVNK